MDFLFKDLIVWQRAMQFAKLVYGLVKRCEGDTVTVVSAIEMVTVSKRRLFSSVNNKISTFKPIDSISKVTETPSAVAFAFIPLSADKTSSTLICGS